MLCKWKTVACSSVGNVVVNMLIVLFFFYHEKKCSRKTVWNEIFTFMLFISVRQPSSYINFNISY